jgi:hypothetical protein
MYTYVHTIPMHIPETAKQFFSCVHEMNAISS